MLVLLLLREPEPEATSCVEDESSSVSEDAAVSYSCSCSDESSSKLEAVSSVEVGERLDGKLAMQRRLLGTGEGEREGEWLESTERARLRPRALETCVEGCRGVASASGPHR